jgi:hypothetical protein
MVNPSRTLILPLLTVGLLFRRSVDGVKQDGGSRGDPAPIPASGRDRQGCQSLPRRFLFKILVANASLLRGMRAGGRG